MTLPPKPLRTRLWGFGLVVLVSCLILGQTSTSLARPGAASGSAATLVVTLAPGAQVAGARKLDRGGRSVALRVRPTDARAVRAQLLRNPAVVAVEADILMPWTNATYTTNGSPNDPLVGDEWGLAAIRWHEAPAVDRPATIAFLDSGIDAAHPDLNGTLADGTPKIASAWSTYSDDPDVTDDFGHGTATASVASALTNNNEGIASIAPQSPIMVVKVGGIDGVRLTDAIQGVDWAVAHGARVINISFASPVNSVALRDAIYRAISRNVVVVAAVGNEGCANDGGGNQLQYPAGYPHVIGVAATQRDGAVACYSNWGREVDIAAPGTDMPLAVPRGERAGTMRNQGGYTTASGTSFAAPVVSAAAALMLGRHPEWTPAQVHTVLARTARDLGVPGTDHRSGAGQLDLTAALTTDSAPLVDQVEVDDDIQFARLRPLLLQNGQRRRSITASVHALNDPNDVYRVVLRRGQRLTISLRGAGGLKKPQIALWKPAARTVTGAGSARTLLGRNLAHRPRRALLISTAPRTGVYYVHVTSASGSGSYGLSLKIG